MFITILGLSIEIVSFPTGVQSSLAYKELIRKIELFTTVLFSVLSVSIVIVFFTAAPYTFVRYYILNAGEDSFYLFCPSWFVFITNWNEINTVVICLFLCKKKVPIRLEITIWIFGGMVGSMCRGCAFGQYLHPISESSHWIVLAVHLHRRRHYTGCGFVQCLTFGIYQNGCKSRRTDETLSRHCTNLFGCKTVRASIWKRLCCKRCDIFWDFFQMRYGIQRNQWVFAVYILFMDRLSCQQFTCDHSISTSKAFSLIYLNLLKLNVDDL